MTVTPSEATDVDVIIIGAGILGPGRGSPHHRAQSRDQLRHLGAPRADRRHLGPVPLPGRALGQQHLHPVLPVGAVDRPRTGGRRRAHPGVPERHRAQVRHRSAHPVQHPRPLGGLELLGRHLDGHRRAGRGREDLPRPLPVLRVRLLQLRRGLHPGLPRPQRVRRLDRSSTALARGSRLPRQEGGGHRQRRHGDVADPVAGREGVEGHHAAAFAHLSVLGGQNQRSDESAAKSIAAQDLPLDRPADAMRCWRA